MRRLQPRHAAAFLVDQDGCVAGAYGFAQGVAQAADLVGVLNIAAEQDETPGPHVTEESALVIRKRETGAAIARAGAHHLSPFTCWGSSRRRPTLTGRKAPKRLPCWGSRHCAGDTRCPF